MVLLQICQFLRKATSRLLNLQKTTFHPRTANVRQTRIRSSETWTSRTLGLRSNPIPLLLVLQMSRVVSNWKTPRFLPTKGPLETRSAASRNRFSAPQPLCGESRPASPFASTFASYHLAEDSLANPLPSHALSTELPPQLNLSFARAFTLSCSCVATFVCQENRSDIHSQFLYRFSRCGELCLGLFTSARADSSLATASVAQPVTLNDPERKAVLLAHCVATKTANQTVLDDDMEVPPNWEKSSKFHTVGHNEGGRTICIHSLAVLSSHQGKGLGQTLLKAYIQRIEQSQAADRIALLAHGELIGFYEMFGFVNKGPSKAKFGGGGWVDMVRVLKNRISKINSDQIARFWNLTASHDRPFRWQIAVSNTTLRSCQSRGALPAYTWSR